MFRNLRATSLFFFAFLLAASGGVHGSARPRQPEVYVDGGVRRAGRGWSAEYNGLQVAYFAGKPQEIGAQMYHLIVAPREEEMLKAFAQIQRLGKTGGILERGFKDFYARFKFAPAFQRVIPGEYLEELRGFMLAASNGRVRGIYDLLMANAFQDVTMIHGGCTAFAAWGAAAAGGGMVVGRNLDYGALREVTALQSLNFYRPEQGLAFVTLNYPAFAGLMHGMNERGVVIAMCYSPAIRTETTVDGIPFMFVLRRALQYGTDLDAAVDIIRRSPRTVGLNILVADARRGQAAVLEVTAHRLAIRRAHEFIYAANRFKTQYMSGFQADGWLSSALRETRLETLQELWRGRFDVAHAVAVLRDKNDPSLAGGAGLLPGIHNEETVAGLVFDPAGLEVWAAAAGGFMAPDAPFVGFSARRIWETGEPQQPLGVIPAAPENEYTRDWRQVMEAAAADDRRIQELLPPIVARYPESEYPMYLLGLSYLRTRRIEPGFALLEKVASLPRITEPFYLMAAHYWLGVFYDTMGERAHALQHYRASLAVDVTDLQSDYGKIRNNCRIGLSRPLAYKGWDE